MFDFIFLLNLPNKKVSSVFLRFDGGVGAVSLEQYRNDLLLFSKKLFHLPSAITALTFSEVLHPSTNWLQPCLAFSKSTKVNYMIHLVGALKM